MAPLCANVKGDRRSLFDAEMRLTRFDPASLLVATHPIQWKGARSGMLDVSCYEGGWQSLQDLPGRQPVLRTTADRISIDPRTRDEHVCLVFEALGVVRNGALVEVSSDAIAKDRMRAEAWPKPARAAWKALWAPF